VIAGLSMPDISMWAGWVHSFNYFCYFTYLWGLIKKQEAGGVVGSDSWKQYM
jgi:hypothetical protein